MKIRYCIYKVVEKGRYNDYEALEFIESFNTPKEAHDYLQKLECSGWFVILETYIK